MTGAVCREAVKEGMGRMVVDTRTLNGETTGDVFGEREIGGGDRGGMERNATACFPPPLPLFFSSSSFVPLSRDGGRLGHWANFE